MEQERREREIGMADRQFLEQLSKALADKGKVIEAGFVAFRLQCIPPSAGGDQVNDMRIAFMAGAQHLFGSILSFLDPGEDITDADLSRMDQVNAELATFAAELEALVTRPARN